MVRWICCAVVLACLPGCKRGSRETAGLERDAGAPIAVNAGPSDGGGGDGAPVLTPAKLQAYAAYRHTQTELTLAGLKDLQGLDAGEDDPAVQGQLYPAMRDRAAKDEAALRESGLSVDEVRYLDTLVTEVIGKRGMGRALDFHAQVARVKSIRDQLPAAQRPALDQSIQMLEAREKDLVNLSEQRRKYGDANVDLVLTREAEFQEDMRRSLEAFSRKMPRPEGGHPEMKHTLHLHMSTTP